MHAQECHGIPVLPHVSDSDTTTAGIVAASSVYDLGVLSGGDGTLASDVDRA